MSFTRAEMYALWRMGFLSQAYAFKPNGSDTVITFDVGRGFALAIAGRNPVQYIAFGDSGLSFDNVESIAGPGAIDTGWAMSPVVDPDYPVLLACALDGSYRIIDGWHRIYKGLKMGNTHFPALLLTREQTEDIII